MFTHTVDGQILHHLRNPGMMISLRIPTNRGFPWFPRGAGFRPSTVIHIYIYMYDLLLYIYIYTMYVRVYIYIYTLTHRPKATRDAPLAGGL